MLTSRKQFAAWYSFSIAAQCKQAQKQKCWSAGNILEYRIDRKPSRHDNAGGCFDYPAHCWWFGCLCNGTWAYLLSTHHMLTTCTTSRIRCWWQNFLRLSWFFRISSMCGRPCIVGISYHFVPHDEWGRQHKSFHGFWFVRRFGKSVRRNRGGTPNTVAVGCT